MKRLFSFVLCFTLLFTLSACGGDTKYKEHTFTKAELAEYSEYYELTTENWTDFIEVIAKEVVEKDPFGEEIGTKTLVTIGLKDGYYISEDNAIRVTYTYVNGYGELSDFTHTVVFFDGYEGRIQMTNAAKDDFVCEKIKGTILKLNIPDDKWLVDENGSRYLNIEGYARISDLTGTYASFVE